MLVLAVPGRPPNRVSVAAADRTFRLQCASERGRMMKVTVREAVETDAAPLVRVRTDSWRAAYAGLIPPAYLDELDATAAPARLAEYLRDPSPGRHYLVAERDGRLVGFVIAGAERPSVEAVRGERAGIGEVHALYVHPDAWFTGTGAALLDAATRRLAKDGYHGLTLWVLEGNTQARRFYERHGWRPDGARDKLRFGGALLPEVRYAAPVRPLGARGLPVTDRGLPVGTAALRVGTTALPVSASGLPPQRRARAGV